MISTDVPIVLIFYQFYQIDTFHQIIIRFMLSATFSLVSNFPTYFHQLLDAMQLRLASHLLRYPLQQHKPNVCPIKSISNPNRDRMMNLDQYFMRHYEGIKDVHFEVALNGFM